MGQLCGCNAGGSPCNINLPPGEYMWHVTGGSNETMDWIAWEYCGRTGGFNESMIFTISNDGSCIPDGNMNSTLPSIPYSSEYTSSSDETTESTEVLTPSGNSDNDSNQDSGSLSNISFDKDNDNGPSLKETNETVSDVTMNKNETAPYTSPDSDTGSGSPSDKLIDRDNDNDNGPSLKETNETASDVTMNKNESSPYTSPDSDTDSGSAFKRLIDRDNDNDHHGPSLKESNETDSDKNETSPQMLLRRHYKAPRDQW
jgi:hypothetical protein